MSNQDSNRSGEIGEDISNMSLLSLIPLGSVDNQTVNNIQMNFKFIDGAGDYKVDDISNNEVVYQSSSSLDGEEASSIDYDEEMDSIHSFEIDSSSILLPLEQHHGKPLPNPRKSTTKPNTSSTSFQPSLSSSTVNRPTLVATGTQTEWSVVDEAKQQVDQLKDVVESLHLEIQNIRLKQRNHSMPSPILTEMEASQQKNRMVDRSCSPIYIAIPESAATADTRVLQHQEQTPTQTPSQQRDTTAATNTSYAKLSPPSPLSSNYMHTINLHPHRIYHHHHRREGSSSIPGYNQQQQQSKHDSQLHQQRRQLCHDDDDGEEDDDYKKKNNQSLSLGSLAPLLERMNDDVVHFLTQHQPSASREYLFSNNTNNKSYATRRIHAPSSSAPTATTCNHLPSFRPYPHEYTPFLHSNVYTRSSLQPPPKTMTSSASVSLSFRTSADYRRQIAQRRLYTSQFWQDRFQKREMMSVLSSAEKVL